MPWTDPTTHIWATFERLTSANLNTYVEANLAFLFGDTTWTNVASFTNSYTSVVTPQYILIGRVVYLRGAVTGGTANTAAFTLPAGYRPGITQTFAVAGANLFCQLQVTAAGAVIPVTTGTSVNLNVNFSVA